MFSRPSSPTNLDHPSRSRTHSQDRGCSELYGKDTFRPARCEICGTVFEKPRWDNTVQCPRCRFWEA